MHDDGEVAASMLEAGATAFVTKSGPPDALLRAVRNGPLTRAPVLPHTPGMNETDLVSPASLDWTLDRLELLIRTGQVRRIRHWGDIDPGGIAIFRDLAALVVAASPAVRVESWRMEPSALSHAAAVPLTARDRSRLQAWIADPAAPLQDVARAMLASDRKLEQEALLVDDPDW